MPANEISIKVDSAAMVAALRDDRFAREPLRHTLVNVGRHAETEAKRRAPVGYGQLKASITHQVNTDPIILMVDVGVIGDQGTLKYAPFMEYGTGLVHDHPNWPRRRTAPTPEQLMNWRPVRRARNPEAMAEKVAENIMKRGGLKPRRYLRGTLEDNSTKYVGWIRDTLRRLRIQ